MTSSRAAPIRVLIVEDDLRFAAAFVQSIEQAPGLALLGHAVDGSQARVLIDAQRPDVLLVDLGLPDADGLDLIRYAAVRRPQCAIMVVTVFGDEDHVVAAIEAGATGYLLKNALPADVIEQIRVLLSGGSPLSPLIARRLLLRVSGAGAPPLRAAGPGAGDEAIELSEREYMVLDHVAKGFTYEETSRLLGVSIHTATTYARRVYRKLQVTSKSEAVFEARRRGLLRH